MSNGLLAQWRRRLAGRGLIGAVLLSVPVAVAATLGFSGAFSDFGSGLRAIGSIGGEAPDAAQSAPLKRVVIKPTAGSAGTGSGGGADGSDGDVGGVLSAGGSGGSSGSGGGGGGSSTGGSTDVGSDVGGGVGGSGGGLLPGAPTVELPSPDGLGGAGSVVDGVNETVNGLLNGRN